MSDQAAPPSRPLEGRHLLVTGIADESSLATAVARELADQGARILCSGLGPTPHHEGLSERARRHLEETYESFCKAVRQGVGEGAGTAVCDLSQDDSVRDLAAGLRESGVRLDGLVHAVARDRTIRSGGAKKLVETTAEEFLDCLDVSAYSLLRLVRGLLEAEVLASGASLVALSYIGAERVVSHPYRNVAVAKAALERIVVELAHELGASDGIRVNAVRFSPYTASRAGGAIPGLEEAEQAAARSAPLGNAAPRHLALEVAHLMRPEVAITGEVRHVDGGFHVLAR